MRLAVRDLTRLGMLGAVSVALYALEAIAPRPLPWMKLGLGNIGIMIALLIYGASAAICLSVIKLFVGSLISGGFGGPAFLVAGGAGLASISVMALVENRCPRVFSEIGLSIIGGITHQVTQLFLAFWLFVGHSGLFSLMPLALLSGLISGALVGLAVHWVILQGGAAGWGS